MLDTQLILLEGMPSTGKTTNSRKINIQLERNQMRAEWVHEVAMPQPVLFFDEVGLTRKEFEEFLIKYPEAEEVLKSIAVVRKKTVEINLNTLQWYYENRLSEEVKHELMKFDTWKFSVERYKEFAIDKWTSFVEQALKKKGKVYLIDSALFQFQIFTFLFQNRPQEELFAFVQRITEILLPLHPVLLFLYRENVETTIRYLENDRGEGYLTSMYQRDKNEPYYRGKPAGAEGFRQFLRDYNALANQMFDHFPGRKLSTEITEGSWPQYEDRILSFLELKRMPDPEAYPVNGSYRNEELGFTITIDGLTMIDPTGKERKLIAKSEKEFYVDWLPVCLKFRENRIEITGTQICERWTVTGLCYQKQEA